MNSKPIIAIDIDDVLAANAQSFIDFSNERFGTKLTIDDYNENAYFSAIILGIDQIIYTQI